MSFETKLNKQYNKIANHVSDMIPGSWEKVYLVAFLEERACEVFSILQFQTMMNYYIRYLFLKFMEFQKRI